MPKVTIWVAYDAAGDAFATTDDAETAASEFVTNITVDGGLRVVELELDLPEIKPIKVSGTVPETDGPVTLTIS